VQGDDIIRILQINQGPSVGTVVLELLDWQLLNPHGTVDEAIEHLRSAKALR
jgi:hypothetical protein